MKPWEIQLRGGCYDGWCGWHHEAEAVLIAWRCGQRCLGHATFCLNDATIVLATAVAYTRTDVDMDARIAVYEVGETDPGERDEAEERELVGAGADVGTGWPVSAPDLMDALSGAATLHPGCRCVPVTP